MGWLSSGVLMVAVNEEHTVIGRLFLSSHFGFILDFRLLSNRHYNKVYGNPGQHSFHHFFFYKNCQIINLNASKLFYMI